MLLFFSVPIFFHSFAIEFPNENHPLIDAIGRSDIPDEENRNLHNFKILDNSVFENFTLVDELFAKASQNCESCVSVDNSLCGKLVSSSNFPKGYERFRVTSVPFFIVDFKLLSCELDNFTFKVLY